jgi:hypothetical protein
MATELAAPSREQPDTAPRYCSIPETAPPALPRDLSPDRARILLVMANKWANGTTLHYSFFTDQNAHGETVTFADGTQEWRTWVGTEAQRQIVRKAFAKWKGVGIGLDFQEVQDRAEAEIRIGFMQGDGSWSYLGTDILKRGAGERTMNFGWDLREAGGEDTALHEIGHTLGLPHEHQNPKAGIVWDEEAVYKSLGGPPNNWPRDVTFHNIIRKTSADSVQGSDWDANSIMHYPFEAGMILQPEIYRTTPLRPAGGLSERDRAWVRTFYPPLKADEPKLERGVSQLLDVRPGEQANFVFEPTATDHYKVQTFGACDTQIVLFEEMRGDWRYLASDDDSGDDRNALVTTRLRRGGRYAVRVRLKHATGAAKPVVMLW